MEKMTKEQRDESIIQMMTHAQRIREIVLQMQLLKIRVQSMPPANQNGEQ